MSIVFFEIFYNFSQVPAGSPKLCCLACNFVLSPAIHHVPSPLQQFRNFLDLYAITQFVVTDITDCRTLNGRDPRDDVD